MKRTVRAIALTAVILLSLPLTARAERMLIPVGQVIGLQLRHDRVTIAAFDDVLGAGAKEAGIRIGDELLFIDDHKIRCAEDVAAALSDCGDRVKITLRRDGRELMVSLQPRQTGEGKKLGLCLRQGVAGIGTVTWFDPETKQFGTLGHGVGTGKEPILAMRNGSAYEARVLGVTRGQCGDPGQLKGEAGQVCGELLRNTPQGVFGINREGWEGTALPVAEYSQVAVGKAYIRANVSGTEVREYSVEILKIYPRDRSDGRNFLLKVTDPDLLSTTGGIVQGMSGSPIIQDGKLVGAVTHVLVNDPTRGYGIFIENMLEAAS